MLNGGLSDQRSPWITFSCDLQREIRNTMRLETRICDFDNHLRSERDILCRIGMSCLSWSGITESTVYLEFDTDTWLRFDIEGFWLEFDRDTRTKIEGKCEVSRFKLAKSSQKGFSSEQPNRNASILNLQ
jgi:hypothetical protein